MRHDGRRGHHGNPTRAPRFIEAAGRRLEYDWLEPEATATARPELVFLHEGLGSVAAWKAFPQRVVAMTGCRGLVYSRYGYGRSEPLHESRSADYLHREAFDALPDLLTSLSIDDPILIGHSDGASIALLYAASGRGRVRGLVLMAPHVFVEDVTLQGVARAKAAFDTTDLASRLGRYHDHPVETFRGWSDAWLQPAFRDWNIEACLPHIEVPTLIIQGEDDQYGTRAQVDAIAAGVKGPVQQVLLSGCGHAPFIDRPADTEQAIATFVANLVSSDSPRRDTT
jgi:pimeloyl-ACP methyl ester carboxylesterase